MVVIPAEAGISSRMVGVCKKIPASAGMTILGSLIAREIMAIRAPSECHIYLDMTAVDLTL